MPFGITLLAPGGRDGLIAALGRRFHADTGLPLGALGGRSRRSRRSPTRSATSEIALAVVGAHLSGMPLNGELAAIGARLPRERPQPRRTIGSTRWPAPRRPSPACCASAAGSGAPIEVEVWALPAEPFGRFVAAVPPPLSIGSLRLADGRAVKGFLVEAEAVDGARDISSFGGWREFVAQSK